MAEMSYLWTTGGAGDGSSTYSRADWAVIVRILAACSGYQGVAPSYLNELAGTVTGANTVAINTGGAVVDGKPYDNTSSVNVNIPSAVGGGNTRIDRIVLRASWSSQVVRIVRIAGTDAASPTPPAITQTSGTTYDIMLYQALVNTSGTVTLTDERIWAIIATDDSTLEQNAGTLRIKDLGVTLAKMAADSVDDTKAGNRVPQFYRRQGGSATDWNVAGTTTRTPTAVRMQAGAISTGSRAAGEFNTVVVTFPVAFSAKPLVLVSPAGNATSWEVSASGESTTQVTIYFKNTDTFTHSVNVNWLAIGTE